MLAQLACTHRRHGGVTCHGGGARRGGDVAGGVAAARRCNSAARRRVGLRRAQHAGQCCQVQAQGAATCLRATAREEHYKQSAEDGAHLARGHVCCRLGGGARWNGEEVSSVQYRCCCTGPRCRSSHASNPENAAASHGLRSIPGGAAEDAGPAEAAAAWAWQQAKLRA